MREAGHLAHRRWLVSVALAGVLATGILVWPGSGAEEPGSNGGPAPHHDGTLLSAAVVSEAGELGIPTRLIVDDRWIFVLDAASDSVLHQFRRDDGVLYRSLGRRGRGPGEFQGAWSISHDRRTGDLWVYDVSLARLSRIVVPQGHPGRAYADTSIQLTARGTATDAVWLDSARLLAPGFYRDARVAVLDGSGRRVGGIGPGFAHWSKAIPQVSQARVALHPDAHLAVLANRNLASIELLDLERATTTTVPGPVALPRGSGPAGLGAIAYVDVAVTATSIYALFSGRDPATVGQRASFGDGIHVYGWDGTLERILRLDGDVIAIAVTEDESAVYALRHEPAPALVRFDLRAVRLARLTSTDRSLGRGP